jgi:hypothetical protein
MAGSPAQALPNQGTIWCCIDHLSWHALPDILLLVPSEGREVALNDFCLLKPPFLRIMITSVSSRQ